MSRIVKRFTDEEGHELFVWWDTQTKEPVNIDTFVLSDYFQIAYSNKNYTESAIEYFKELPLNITFR